MANNSDFGKFFGEHLKKQGENIQKPPSNITMATTGGEEIDVEISPALTPDEIAALRALRIQAGTAPLSLEDSKRYNILQAKQLARMEDLNAKLVNQVQNLERRFREPRSLRHEPLFTSTPRSRRQEKDEDSEDEDPIAAAMQAHEAELSFQQIAEMTEAEVNQLKIDQAKLLLSNLPREQQTFINLAKVAARVSVAEAKEEQTRVKRSNDAISAPKTGKKKRLTQADEKSIKLAFGDAKYANVKTRTITMRELLRKHRRLVLDLDLSTSAAVAVLQKVAQGSLADTLLRFEEEKYSLERVYHILQQSYADAPTIKEAQEELRRLITTFNPADGVFALMTEVIKTTYQINQFSPPEIRQWEAIHQSSVALFEFLRRNYDSQSCSQLQDEWNCFRAERGATIAEEHLWQFLETVRYRISFSATRIHHADKQKFNPHHKVRAIEEPDPEEELEQLENMEFVNQLQNWQPMKQQQQWIPRPQVVRPQNQLYGRPPMTRFQPPQQVQMPNHNPRFAILQRPQPQPSQHQQQAGQKREPSTNPNDYAPTIVCWLCSGNSFQGHAPPFAQFCNIFPNQLPTGKPCPECKGRHRLSANGGCTNPLLPAIRKANNEGGRVQELEEPGPSTPALEFDEEGHYQQGWQI